MTTSPENTAAPSGALAQPGPKAIFEDRAQNVFKPSAASGIFLIVKRELTTYFTSRSGYVIAALALLLDGLYFNLVAVGSSPRYSTEVLSEFIYGTSGMAMIAGLVISMRLIAEDRQSGALPLLTTSSLSDGEVVLAKFLSGFLFLSVLLLVTIYMPLLIFINGKVSIGHIFAGYVGLLSLGAASTAIGTFGSAIAGSQVVALVISLAIWALLLFQWALARVVEGPLSDVIGYMSFHDKHFRPFMEGTLSIRDVVYYLAIAALFLVLARNALEGRRWRP